MMTRPRIPRQLVLASLSVILTLTAGGVVYAYTGASGGGFGTATTATTEAVTLGPGTPTGDLFPGGQAAVVLSVSNPNASNVRVGSLALDPGQGAGGYSVDGGHSGCDLSTLSFTAQTNGGAGWTVPGSGSLPITLTNALGMGLGAASACQNATFTVYLAAGP